MAGFFWNTCLVFSLLYFAMPLHVHKKSCIRVILQYTGLSSDFNHFILYSSKADFSQNNLSNHVQHPIM